MWKRKKTPHEIVPEDIFLDASNLPAHDTKQFEGRVEKPMSRRTIFGVAVVFILISIVFCGRAYDLEVAHGAAYADISRSNSLDSDLIFAARGIIYDKNGKELAWNVPAASSSSATSTPFALRQYTTLPGFSILLGYVAYPRRDQSGTWWREDYAGVSGLELSYNDELEGINGSSMVETDARKNIERENIVSPPVDGQNLTLSIDSDIQSELYTLLSQHAAQNGFRGGAAVIMDVRTGQIIALTSFPQYDDNAFQAGDSTAIKDAAIDPYSPLLNRAVSGLYAPGSIVKTIFAAGALDAGIISPDKTILSTGAITIPNPYDPAHPSVFHDWTAHGEIDMRTAIAVSSDEYFYTIGGGYGDQKGLGIAGLDKYAALFGLGSKTGIDLPGELAGTIPSPQWKAAAFNGAPWLLGDTYHTGIGQYGFQITPIQAVRFAAAIANGGKLLVPHLIASSTPQFTQIGISDADLEVVREGMRLAVTSDRKDATVKELYLPGIDIAAKTGTAQIGNHNQWVNSWGIGFWPATDPKYAYAVVFEQGPSTETAGATPGLVPFFQWLIANHPEYVN